MLNFYDTVKSNKNFKKFIVNELLFCEYKCPIEQKEMGIWSHINVFLFVLSGKKKWKTLKAEYLISGGDALLIKKGAGIIEQFFDESFCGLAIFVPDDFIKNVIEKYQLKFFAKGKDFNSDKIIKLKLDEVLNSYFHSIFSYFSKPEAPPKELLKIKFEELVINILSGGNNPEAIQYLKEIFQNNKISIREIMDENFTFNLRLEDYARMCGRSLSVFKKDFEKTFGESPGRWLTGKRLQYAKYLIENSNKSLDEIVLYSGFKNQSHFIRIFKEKYGTTPHKLKKELISA